MVNRRQFVLTKKEFNNEGFKKIVLKDGFFLYCEDSLPRLSVKNDKNIDCILLGLAFQASPEREDPEKELIKCINNNGDILDVLVTLSGRYILIFDGYIFLDAFGMLGCFYTKDGVFSSSMNIIGQLCGFQYKKPRIVHNCGIDYYPGPRTPYNDVYRLMPSQYISYRSGELHSKVLLPNLDRYSTYKKDLLIHEFCRWTTTMFKNMEKNYDGSILLALTGGYDSRTTLALLCYAGMDFETFTLGYENIAPTDFLLAQQLSEALNKKHTFIKKPPYFSKKLASKYDLHSYGMSVGLDRDFFARSQYPIGDKSRNHLILRSSIYAVSIDYYDKYLQMSDVYKDHYNANDNAIFRSLEEYNNYIRSDVKNDNVSFKTRYFWEQRSGSWLSSIEQTLDLLDYTDSIQPMNCTELICMLMSFESRRKKQAQEEIIKLICPKIAKIPYDKEIIKTNNSNIKRLKRKLKHFLSLSRAAGLSSGFIYLSFGLQKFIRRLDQ